MLKAVEIIHLAGELEVDSDSGEESDSESEDTGEECFQDDSSAQGKVILLAIEMLKEHQKGDTDCESLAQWENATVTPTRDELHASHPFLRVLAQHLARIAEVDEMLVLR